MRAGRDERGEDAVIELPSGVLCAVQIVTVPTDPEFNAEIASGSSHRMVSLAEVVQWIRSAIEKKYATYAAADRASMILALDARRILVDEAIIGESIRQSPPLESYGFAEIWLVGPTVPRARRLISAGGGNFGVTAAPGEEWAYKTRPSRLRFRPHPVSRPLSRVLLLAHLESLMVAICRGFASVRLLVAID
jgi:hypothetical protein